MRNLLTQVVCVVPLMVLIGAFVFHADSHGFGTYLRNALEILRRSTYV